LDLLTVAEILRLAEQGNRIPDPGSVLIGRRCRIGRGNLFYPGVLLQCGPAAVLAVGDGNCFWPGATLAVEAGEIRIGDENQFGPGGFSASLDAGGGRILVGNGGRYRDGAGLFAGTEAGDGTQVLGPIQVQACRLGGGGGAAEPDPDRRGGVLKGCGRARGLTVGRGEVILGEGRFAPEMLTRQIVFHPQAQNQRTAS
jgi:hypothetical protein